MDAKSNNPRNCTKSKLSLRRKAESRTVDPIPQKLLTKQLVPPKLKSKPPLSKTSGRKIQSNLVSEGEGGSDGFVGSTSEMMCSVGGGVHKEEDKCVGDDMEKGSFDCHAVKREGNNDKDGDGTSGGGEQDLGCGVSVAETVGDEDGRGLGGVAQNIEEEVGLGELYFCHVCQKDLTKFNLIRRQAHINRCCDENPAGQSEMQLLHACVLCKKTFNNEIVKNQHMKSCAKSKGLTTAQLLDKVRQSNETPCDCPSLVKKQMTLRNVLNKADDDFKQPPPPLRTKRRKRNAELDLLGSLGDDVCVEDEQLQLALAMSASLASSSDAMCSHHQQIPGASEEERNTFPGGRRRKRKRGDPVHLPLLSVSSQQCRDRIAHRAEQLLIPATADMGMGSEEIPCTPAFGNSKLAVGVVSAVQSTEPKLENEEDVLFASDEESDCGKEARQGLGNCLQGLPLHQSPEPSPSKSKSVSKDDDKDCDDDEVGDGESKVGRSGPDECGSGGGRLQSMKACMLWQLGSSDFTAGGCREFYVSALSSAISPMKTNPMYCRLCDSSTCLGTLPASSPAPNLENEPATTTPPKDQCSSSSSSSSGNVARSSLLSDLHSMINSCLLSDLTIFVRAALGPDTGSQTGSQLSAHRCLLAARCKGFREVMEDGGPHQNILDLSSFDRSAVLAFLEHVYTGECHGTQAKEVQVIHERMSSAEEVRKITRYSSDKLNESIHATAGKCDGDKRNESTCLDNSDLTESRRQSCVLFSESPSSLVAESPRDKDESLSPAHPSPPSPVLVTSVSNSPITPSSEVHSLAAKKELSPTSKYRLSTDKPKEPLIVNNFSTMDDDSFDIPTPTYVSSCSPSPSYPQVDTRMGASVSRASSSSSGDLVLCGVSQSQVILGDSESGEEMDHVKMGANMSGNRSSLVTKNGEKNNKHSKEDKEAVVEKVVELLEEVASLEDAADKENMESEGNKTMLEDESNVALDEIPPLAAEDEDLFYVNDQFETDWLLDATDYNAAFNSSSSRRNSTSSQPPPSSHSSRNSAALGSHSQAPAPPRKDSVSFVTPASVRDSSIVSDDNVTPMPQYHNMATPCLKKEGQRFGMRGLPKRKMITKLMEIYSYTHPLVAEDGTIVPEDIESESIETLSMRVKHAITLDHELYQDILLYKPLDLSFIQNKLKSSGVVLAKDKLMDVLDFMCVTYTEPRSTSKKRQKQAAFGDS